MEPPKQLPQELIHKLEELYKHGDSAFNEMLEHLITEAHGQMQEDPKSRVSMKNLTKGLMKIIPLPSGFNPEDYKSNSKTPVSKYWIWAIAGVLLVSAFIIPWAIKTDSQNPPTRVCDIKGNINVDGKKIYHAPHSKWYSKTFIDKSLGERWFCSEDGAKAAGWRKSLH